MFLSGNVSFGECFLSVNVSFGECFFQGAVAAQWLSCMNQDERILGKINHFCLVYYVHISTRLVSTRPAPISAEERILAFHSVECYYRCPAN